MAWCIIFVNDDGEDDDAAVVDDDNGDDDFKAVDCFAFELSAFACSSPQHVNKQSF